jgi:hypothetical protein
MECSVGQSSEEESKPKEDEAVPPEANVDREEFDGVADHFGLAEVGSVFEFVLAN